MGCGKEEQTKYVDKPIVIEIPVPDEDPPVEDDPDTVECTVVIHSKKKVVTTIKCEDYTYKCKKDK